TNGFNSNLSDSRLLHCPSAPAALSHQGKENPNWQNRTKPTHSHAAPMPSDPSHRLQQPPSLAAKVHWLQQPATYPHAPQRIDAIETHMSWVFLADEYVYKLKKPVRRDFLDFSTLEARHRNCEEELRLNRRLAPEVYLNVVPLTIDAAGTVRLGGQGEVLDWLVRMRRLPAECMLDYAIRHGTVRDDEIRRLALRLAEFYAASAPIRMG